MGAEEDIKLEVGGAPAMGMGIQPAGFQGTGQGPRYGYEQPQVMNMYGGRSMGGGGMPYMSAQPRMQGPPIRTRSQQMADIDAHMDTLSIRSPRWSKVPFDDIRRLRPAVKAWEAQQMQRQQMMGWAWVDLVGSVGRCIMVA